MLTKKLIIAMMFILMLAAGSAQAGGDAAKGEELAVDCADCHGDDGLGDEDYPAIAGMDAADQLKELMDFKSGAREDEEAAGAFDQGRTTQNLPNGLRADDIKLCIWCKPPRATGFRPRLSIARAVRPMQPPSRSSSADSGRPRGPGDL